MDGHWFAHLSRRGESFRWPLAPFADVGVGTLSEHAIRAGYIGLAEWLVKNGGLPEPAEAAPLEQHLLRAPARIQPKAAPLIDRAAQDQIGHELRAVYAEMLDEPVPDELLALLGAADIVSVAAMR